MCIFVSYLYSARKKKKSHETTTIIPRYHLDGSLKHRLSNCRGYKLEILLRKIETYQNEMDELMKIKTKGTIIRSKAKWIFDQKKKIKNTF